jgi:ATP-dependent helicase/nuclease subunit B
MRVELSEYSNFLPTRTPEQNFTWAMHTGEMMQKLRETLVDGGYRIADVYRDFGNILQELERWRDMAKLETAYLARLEELGLQDPCELMIKRSESPVLPEGIERIIIAAVPDPTPRTLCALEHLSALVSIVILIHAPESLADCFDNWGRPVAEKWNDTRIDIPDAERNIILTGSPVLQSRKVMEIMAEEAGNFGPGDIAIGVPDSGVTTYLAAELMDRGMTTFDPAGKSPGGHPLYHLLDTFRALVNDGTYAAFSAFLRHADVLNYLEIKLNISARWLLEDLDNFQNQYMPPGVQDITCRFPREAAARRRERREFARLEKAVMFIQNQVNSFKNGDLDSAVRSLLQTIYEVRMVNPGSPDDEEFRKVAQLVDPILRELAGETIEVLGIEKEYALELLLQRLKAQHYYPERKGAIIDLEGWLELPWDDAPFLIVTGMNEGFVPDSRLGDVFLPDSLRRQLGLRHDMDRIARDAYLMRGLIESRQRDGRVCFMVNKTSSTGDPLKPSRLLFHCSDVQLPQRARQLFSDTDDTQGNYPPTVSFLLEASPPADVPAGRLDLKRMSVTRFKDYLACPFRFYLKHVLGMESLSDEKGEMDALDFGSLVHEVLHKMARSDGIWRCENDGKLGELLCTEAENWVTERFGKLPPLQIKIQLDAAQQRLRAAARVQADLVRKGWEIVASEIKMEFELGGIPVSGKIDRIDRHRETGRIRILDYKTSDRAQSPEEAHLGPVLEDIVGYMKVDINGKVKRWTDLQLPLYRMLLPEEEIFQGPIGLGYFNLPKAVNDTGVVIWEDFSDELLESARGCAESMVKDIQNRRFWPPASKVQFDDFESLFPAAIPDCIDVTAFETFRGEEAG